MGNSESHECIDVDSVEQEAGLLDIKTCLSKFDDLRGEKLIKQLRGDNDRKADDGRGGAIGQRNKRDEEELARRPLEKRRNKTAKTNG